MYSSLRRVMHSTKNPHHEGGTIMVYKEGHSSYGHCWIEGDGVTFYVYVMDGRSQYGPFSSLSDAISEYNRYCS